MIVKYYVQYLNTEVGWLNAGDANGFDTLDEAVHELEYHIKNGVRCRLLEAKVMRDYNGGSTVQK